VFEDTACMIHAHLKHLQTADIADLNSVTIATVRRHRRFPLMGQFRRLYNHNTAVYRNRHTKEKIMSLLQFIETAIPTDVIENTEITALCFSLEYRIV